MRLESRECALCALSLNVCGGGSLFTFAANIHSKYSQRRCMRSTLFEACMSPARHVRHLSLRATARRATSNSTWNEDSSELRKVELCIDFPLFENSVARDGVWRTALELAHRGGQLGKGWNNRDGELGDAQLPFLGADLGSYNPLRSCIQTQEDIVGGTFATEQEAADAIRALRMVTSMDQLLAPMHNQFGILKGNILPRLKMGSIETERVQHEFSVFKASSEGHGFRDKKELMHRRQATYLAVLQRRFHIYESTKWITRVNSSHDGELSEKDYLRLFLMMIDESNCDEEAALMNKETLDDTLPLQMEIRMIRIAVMEGIDLTSRYWLPWLQECHCTHIFRHRCESLFAPYGRSAEPATRTCFTTLRLRQRVASTQDKSLTPARS
jgi:hypothetical protein